MDSITAAPRDDAGKQSPPDLAPTLSVCLATPCDVIKACGHNADCPETPASMGGNSAPLGQLTVPRGLT